MEIDLNWDHFERDYTRKVFSAASVPAKRKFPRSGNQCDRYRIRVEPVENCLRLLTDKHIRHLPSVEGDQVVGVT